MNLTSLSDSARQNILRRASAARRRPSSIGGKGSSPSPRPAPTSTVPSSSEEEENVENLPPPTLLQRRKMDPLSPIAFNFGAPHCGAIGKTYIKIRPRSLSPVKKPVVPSNNPARGAPAPAGKQRATPLSAKLASIRKMQQRSSSSRRGGTQTATSIAKGKGGMPPPSRQNAVLKEQHLPPKKMHQASPQQPTGRDLSEQHQPRKQNYQHLRQKHLGGEATASTATSISPLKETSIRDVEAAKTRTTPPRRTPPKYRDASSVTPPKHPAPSSQQLQLSPAMQKLMTKYGSSSPGNDDASTARAAATAPSADGARRTSRSGTPLAGRRDRFAEIMERKQRERSLSVPSQRNDEEGSRNVRADDKRGRYAEIMERKQRDRSLSATSRNDKVGKGRSPPRSPVIKNAQASGRSIARTPSRTRERTALPSTMSPLLPSKNATAASGCGAGGQSRAELIEMHRRKKGAVASTNPTSSRLQREAEDLDTQSRSMSALTTVSAALDSHRPTSSLSSSSSVSRNQQWQQLSTPSNKLDRMRKYLDRGRRSVSANQHDVGRSAKGDASTTSPLPPRCGGGGDVGGGARKPRQHATKRQAIIQRSLSRSRDASLERTASYDSVRSGGSGLDSVPSSENGLGVTQSCSFTNNATNGDGGSGEDLTQLQLRRRRAREVLARRNSRS